MEGIVNFGTASINDVSCLEIQNNCITNEGSIIVNEFFQTIQVNY